VPLPLIDGGPTIVGQNGQPGQQRMKTCTLLGTGGHPAQLSSPTDFAIPAGSGSGYFFSPSMSTLTDVLAGA
jgi:hypothetical protein